MDTKFEAGINIEPYSLKNKTDFERIWTSWLVNAIGIKPQQEDLNDVRNPMDCYIARGGMVFYANKNNECYGVVGVKKISLNNYEFGKLVVVDKARGNGLGKRLVQTCIDYVVKNNGSNLYLQTNHILEQAIKMYSNMGFVHTSPPEEMNVLSRTDTIMKKPINEVVVWPDFKK